ncbi:FecR domain-containing protein [uncultured Agitococcus sp.]|uniref:FecR family protein n=1 Tax=uncultured Agitococcus sp. TaxID=1506599 RepID=UPI0026209CAB|nr:FecR domain-containing protein [uncultured Agitococcus sp.]
MDTLTTEGLLMNSLENKFPFSQLRLVAAIGLFAASQSLFAAEIAGRVNFVSGSAFVSNAQNQQRNVFKGDLIYAGEKIETGRNSRIQIKMTDGGTIVLRPSSTFEITQYSFSKDTPELGTVLYNFIKGGARAISGAIGKVNKQNYKFNTPVATIGIRGTDYSASLDDNKLLVTVSDGKISITNQQGEEEAKEGETFAVNADQKPTLCHTVNTAGGTCDPVFISLDTDDNLSFSKQKVKKPTIENFATYGAFTEAMRRYKSLEQEVQRIEDDFSVNDVIEKATKPVDTPRLTPFAQTDLAGFDNLDNAELSNFSVENAIGIIENELDTDINQGMINDINNEDILLKKVFKYKLEEDTTEITSKVAYNLADFIDFKGFIENLFLLNTDTLYGNNMRMQGVEVGNPKINVELGNSIFDAINVQLAAATRNKSYALNLGLNDNNLFSLLDDNKNNQFGGLLSIRQVAIYDRDGLGVKDSIGGFLQIGNGSPSDAILVLTDDNTPIKASLDLFEIQRLPSSKGFFDLANKTTINVNLQTPKILAKLGGVYIGSFSTITNRDTDSVAVLEEVTDSSFNRKSLIKIFK